VGDSATLLRALKYAATFDLSVWMSPRDASLMGLGVAHEGEVATRLGLPAVPALAETLAVSSLLLMARETGVALHLCRLSAGESVEMVRQARARGQVVTCDVSSHHLHLSEMDIGYFDTNCRLSPPLRSLRDRDALVAGVADGTIDAICSDHSPVNQDGKELPFAEADPGASGLETLLSLTLMRPGDGGLAEKLAPVTVGPSRILRLPVPRLELGAVADICIFDPDDWWRVQPADFVSRGRNTPFAGYELRGRVRYCLVGGRVVHGD
jgi:dihydroorotase